LIFVNFDYLSETYFQAAQIIRGPRRSQSAVARRKQQLDNAWRFFVKFKNLIKALLVNKGDAGCCTATERLLYGCHASLMMPLIIMCFTINN
jgi:hypothetical protein